MRKDIVLNDLSVREASSVYVAREQMGQLVATLLAAIQAGANRSLRTHLPVNEMLLAEDYPISRWRNDPSVEREQRSFLRTLLSKSPYLTEEDGAEILGSRLETEFKFDNRTAVGLGAAILLDALPVSLGSEPCWDSSQIEVHCISLDPTGEVFEDLIRLAHASKPEHIDDHVEWLSDRDEPITSGRDLWQRREQLFPALVFCDSVGDQISAISRGEPLLGQIIKRLSELDQYFRSWDGNFKPDAIPMKITPESEPSLQKYEDEHSFICPDGVRRLFSWHARLTPGAWRIYFAPVPETRQAMIGYIGRKLPNLLYPT